MNRPHALRRLVLTDFRNFAAGSLDLPATPVVLTGANGAGKTNILEAVSLLVPGRGLRQAGLDDLPRIGGAGGWAVAARVEAEGGLLAIGTGIAPGSAAATREARIDGVPAGSVQALADVFAAVWLTPQMDGVLSGSAGDRRRFFDRLTLAGDPAHAGRYSAFERAMRQRNRHLEEFSPDRRLLDAIEAEMAAHAVAVAAARVEAVDRLKAAIAGAAEAESPFPWAGLELSGTVEDLLKEAAATAAEDAYREILAAGRAADARAGRTLAGPHRSDVLVRHGPKDVEARRSSTGEQKALLVGLLLAHAGLMAERGGRAPVLLFDEIAAHLDDLRRQALFDRIEALGVQALMTGTDAALFAPLEGRAAFLEVAAGGVRPRP
ncbi:MAG: DNA replication/repair protein RecF [Flavobacteriaceae bacterium]